MSAPSVASAPPSPASQHSEEPYCAAAAHQFQVLPSDPNFNVKLNNQVMPTMWEWYTQKCPDNLVSYVNERYPKPFHAFLMGPLKYDQSAALISPKPSSDRDKLMSSGLYRISEAALATAGIYKFLSESITEPTHLQALSALFQIIGSINFHAADTRRRIMLLPRLGQTGTHNFLQYSLPSDFQYDSEVLAGPELHKEFTAHVENRKKAGAHRARENYAPPAKRARTDPLLPPARVPKKDFRSSGRKQSSYKKPAAPKEKPFPKGPSNQRGASNRYVFRPLKGGGLYGCQRVGGSYSRPLDPVNSSGGVCYPFLPPFPVRCPGISPKSGWGIHNAGDLNRSYQQGLRKTSQPSSRAGSIPHFLEKEKLRRTQTYPRPDLTEQINPKVSVQDEVHRLSPVSSRTGRLDGQAGPQRRLFLSEDKAPRQEITTLPSRRETVRVPGAPKQVKISTVHLHQTVKTSGGLPSEPRCQDNYLPGRPMANCEQQRLASGASKTSSECTIRPRFFNKLEKIGTRTVPVIRIPGFHCKLPKDDFRHQPGETGENPEPVSPPVEQANSYRETNGQSPGLPTSSRQGVSNSSPTLQTTAVLQDPFHRGTGETAPIRRSLGKAEKAYQQAAVISPEVKQEIQWWIDNLKSIPPAPIQELSLDLEIFSDASLYGWGAWCSGEPIQVTWTAAQSLEHINVLEFKAATTALEYFSRHLKRGRVRLMVDNKAILWYINKMGGTRSRKLLELSLQIWKLALDRNLTIHAKYIPSAENKVADLFSRKTLVKGSTWKLQRTVFNRIAQKWGMPVIDLFASRDNNQVERFLTWRPDPLAVGTDAMQWNWDKEHLVYAFLHVSMIWKVLQKLKKHRRTTMILIAPAWITRHWYPIPLSLLIERPIPLGKNPDLLLDQQLQRQDLQVLGHLNLVAWKVYQILPGTRVFSPSVQSHGKKMVKLHHQDLQWSLENMG